MRGGVPPLLSAVGSRFARDELCRFDIWRQSGIILGHLQPRFYPRWGLEVPAVAHRPMKSAFDLSGRCARIIYAENLLSLTARIYGGQTGQHSGICTPAFTCGGVSRCPQGLCLSLRSMLKFSSKTFISSDFWRYFPSFAALIYGGKAVLYSGICNLGFIRGEVSRCPRGLPRRVSGDSPLPAGKMAIAKKKHIWYNNSVEENRGRTELLPLPWKRFPTAVTKESVMVWQTAKTSTESRYCNEQRPKTPQP